MELLVKSLMKRNVHTVTPDTTLPNLEQQFIDQRAGGFPVVQGDQLVGLVSRSDIVRQLCLEHHVAESVSDFYRDESGFHEIPLTSYAQVADRVGERIEGLTVADVMSRHLLSVTGDQPIRVAAQMLCDNHVHRLPVVKEGRLIGIVTAIDLVQQIADGHLTSG